MADEASVDSGELSADDLSAVMSEDNLLPPSSYESPPDDPTAPAPDEVGPRLVTPPPRPAPTVQNEERNLQATIKVPMSSNQLVRAMSPPGSSPRRAAAQTLTFAQRLDQLANTPDGNRFSLIIKRISPAFYDGYRLPVRTEIMREVVMPLSEIRDIVETMFGGGVYSVVLVNNSNETRIDSSTIRIDELSISPVIPTNARRALPSRSIETMAGTRAPEADELAASKIDIEKAKLEMAKENAMAELEENRARNDKRKREREERERAEEEARRMAPQNHAVDALRAEFMGALNGIKEALSNKGDDKTTLLLIKSMEQAETRNIKSMETLATMMTSMVTAMSNKGNDGSMTEIMKLAAASNEKVLSTALEASKQNQPKENTFDQEILKAIILKQVNAPEQSLQTMLNMQAQGKKDAMEMLQLAQRFQQGEGDIIDPEASFGTNVLNVVGHVANRAMDTFGGVIQQKLQSTVMPQAPAFNPHEFQAGPVIDAPSVSTVPGIPSSPALPAPPAPAPQLTPAQPQQRTMQEVPGPFNPNVFMGKMAVKGEPVQQPAQPQVTVAADDSLVIHVSDALTEAITDLQVGRSDPDWVDIASGKWGRSFLTQLINAGNDHARLQLLQQSCDVEVFNRFIQVIRDADNNATFFKQLNELLEKVAEQLNVRRSVA